MNPKFSKLFFPYNEKPQHFQVLDGLRGIAVLLVLLSHSSNAGLFFYEHLNFQKTGQIGVYLFFVLSAYLLDRQIATALISGKSTNRYWVNYFLRRFLRIYPLFVIALIFHGIFSYFGIKTAINEWTDFPLHLLLLRGEAIFWSIPVEFKYYLISPAIMLLCHKYLRWNLKKVMLLFLFVIISSIAVELTLHLSTISSFRYLPVFLTGALIAICELLHKNSLQQKYHSKLVEGIGFLSLSVIILTIPYYFNQVFGENVDFHHAGFYLPYALLWGAILIATKHGTGIMKAIAELKLLRFFGVISFSLYLFHSPILMAVNSSLFDIPEYLKIYAFFILSMVLSSVSYLSIEKPLSKIRIYDKLLTEDLEKGIKEKNLTV